MNTSDWMRMKIAIGVRAHDAHTFMQMTRNLMISSFSASRNAFYGERAAEDRVG